jgi:hypothetical protein
MLQQFDQWGCQGKEDDVACCSSFMCAWDGGCKWCGLPYCHMKKPRRDMPVIDAPAAPVDTPAALVIEALHAPVGTPAAAVENSAKTLADYNTAMES